MARTQDAALDRTVGKTDPGRALAGLLARLSAAWARRRTRARLRRLDAEQLKDIGLTPGSSLRDRWM